MNQYDGSTKGKVLDAEIGALRQKEFASAEERYHDWASLLKDPRFDEAPAGQRTEVFTQAAAALSDVVVGTDDQDRWDEVVALLEQAVATAPVEEASHGMAVINLSSTLGTLYGRTNDLEVWRRGIELVQRWRSAIPPDDWRAALYVLAHAVLLYRRATGTSAEEDVRAAIKLLEEARSLVPWGAGVYCTSSTLLADLRLRRYSETVEPADLEAAIEDALDVVKAERALPHERLGSQLSLALALTLRHEAVSSSDDLDLALALANDAIEMARSRQDRVNTHRIRARAFRHRFHLTREPADLEGAIDSYAQVAQLAQTEGDREAEAADLDNYANGLGERYELNHAPEDLHSAIEARRKALALLPSKSSYRAGILKNLGIDLTVGYETNGDLSQLDAAIRAFRSGLDESNLQPEIESKLLAHLGRALVHQAALGNEATRLLDEGLAAFDQAHKLLDIAAPEPVEYALGHLQTWSDLVELHVGALLWRASLRTDESPRYLRRAMAIGEGVKSQLLAQEMLRFNLAAPPGVRDGMLEVEQMLLAQLSAIDAAELSGWEGVRRVTRMERRKAVRKHLDDLWDEMREMSPAAAEYAALRRASSETWMLTLDKSDPDVAYLALLTTRNVGTVVGTEVRPTRGMAVLAMRPGDPAPIVVTPEQRSDPVPDSVRRFEAEVPADGGLGLRAETWHNSLVQLIEQVADAFPEASRVVISPPNNGRGLPWHLVLERAGWRSQDGSRLPVVTVPTLSVVQASSTENSDVGRGRRWHQVPNVSQRFGLDDREGARLAIRVTRRVDPGPPAGEPLVVGNPTGDLPDAEKEAQSVAELLGSHPLLGPAGTVERVREALEFAPVVHLAAHAHFDQASPLDSEIHLANGMLSARELIGEWSAADLIVLSACESGVGGMLMGTEVAGLAHALLRCGARVVIASLWPVDDGSTAWMMAEFHQLRQEGVDEATALAVAMTSTREQPGWHHPYFWSGFVLVKGGSAQ